ncbi:MAG: transglycosylase SLT domain-containing protein [Anaerolineaceae bacterium]|nr:transglycosylase SLT domain-containing protein [Anaerolineaceae bacterium]
MSRVQTAIFPAILLGCTLIVFLSAASPDNVRLVSNNIQQLPASAKPVQAASNGSNFFQQIMAKVIPDQSASNTSTSCDLSNSYPAAIHQWCGPITKYAHQYNLDPNLIAAVIEIESGGNSQAYSPDGAVGLMQIMPRDGLAAGFMCGSTSCFASRPSSSELLNPDANIAYGARMLAGLVQRNGNVRDALYRYGPINEGYSYADRVLQIYQSHR